MIGPEPGGDHEQGWETERHGSHLGLQLHPWHQNCFQKVVWALKKVFVLGKSESSSFTYVGWQVEQDDNKGVKVHQELPPRHGLEQHYRSKRRNATG